MGILDFSIITILILVGFNLKHLFRSFSKQEKRILDLLFLLHLVITIAFNFYIGTNGGDAVFYWDYPKNHSFSEIVDYIERGSASGIIFLINFIPSKVLDLSFLSGNIIFSVLGYLGFIYLFLILKQLLPADSKTFNFKVLGIKVIPWIWFLPNLHFWSCGIGKDTILFFCIAHVVYSLLNVKKRWIGIAFSGLLMLTIRPHMLLFLIVSFGVGFTLDSQLKVYQRLFILVVFLGGFIVIFDYVLEFVQLDSFEFQTIEEYASNKSASLNQEDSSSGVDTSNYPLPLKVFTFLYRPFFFDINGILAIVASFENLLLLYFSFLIVKKGIIRAFKKGSYLLKGFLIYFIIGSIAFSLILGNLGIMLRQKNMFFPLFFIFGIWAIHLSFQKKQLS